MKQCGDDAFNSLVLYTIDPTGNWKHWGGGGTCIGKGSHLVRKHLHQLLYEYHQDAMTEGVGSNEGKKHHPENWRQALDVAMRATFLAIENDGNEVTQDGKITAQYDAIVLFGKGKVESDACRCAKIDQKAISESYLKCIADSRRPDEYRSE